MSRSALILAVALLGTISQPAAAVDRHVATPAAGGSDTNPGTAGSPWATIQHAVENVGPGDRILVHAGTFVGARIEVSGTAAQPITLTAAPGEAVLVQTPGPGNSHGSTIEVETFDAAAIVAWWVIAGFEIVGGTRSGIDVRNAHHVTVRGNRVRDSGLTGIFTAFADDLLIEDNESYDNGEHGIYTSNSGDRPTVRRNYLHGNAGAGVHMNADAGQGGDGIITGARVEANVIADNGTAGGAGINLDGVVGAKILNNLIYDEHASGIAVFRQDGAVCSHDNLIAANTVLTAADGRWGLVMPDPGCTNNRVIDNVFWTAHSFRGSIAIWTPLPAGFESHHNAVMNRFSTDGGDTVITLAQWQALGHGTGSFVTTPAALFVDPAGDDYHLAPASPAIDAGVTLPEVTEDLEGVPRPAGARSDVGCYESGLIFADGFESGDTGGWSAAVP